MLSVGPAQSTFMGFLMRHHLTIMFVMAVTLVIVTLIPVVKCTMKQKRKSRKCVEGQDSTSVGETLYIVYDDDDKYYYGQPCACIAGHYGI